ncbi:hypothetical protein [Sphingomonas faeni]
MKVTIDFTNWYTATSQRARPISVGMETQTGQCVPPGVCKKTTLRVTW